MSKSIHELEEELKTAEEALQEARLQKRLKESIEYGDDYSCASCKRRGVTTDFGLTSTGRFCFKCLRDVIAYHEEQTGR